MFHMNLRCGVIFLIDAVFVLGDDCKHVYCFAESFSGRKSLSVGHHDVCFDASFCVRLLGI